MDQAKLIAIICGVGFFLIILVTITYFNSDFDQQLIHGKEIGTKKEVLIHEIKKKSELERLHEEKCLQGHIMDMKYWNKTNLTIDYLEYDTKIYKRRIHDANECEKVRIQYINEKITKTEYLERIRSIK